MAIDFNLNLNFKRFFKLIVTSAVACVILISLVIINSLISDREQYRRQAVESIEQSYAGTQTIVGPVLVRPFTRIIPVEEEEEGVKKLVQRTEQLTATSFPRVLDLRGKLSPSQRRHGLYSVTVYEFEGHLKGNFEATPPTNATGKVEWGEPYLAFSVQDVRGIVGTPKVLVNGAAAVLEQTAERVNGWQPNLRIPLHQVKELSGNIDFSLDMDLAGTESLNIAPAGDSNHVEMNSPWSSPLFAGSFLPRTREVSSAGFTAAWDVSSLAAATQRQMLQGGKQEIDTLDVKLLNPVDPYKLSDRATKYGALFVIITFGGFMMFEMLKDLAIHPMQYLLVGLGLAIFFLLLISLSEHVAFGMAYGIASAACIGLLGFYLSYVLRSPQRGASFAVMLSVLYTAVYGLLISEDNALLLGSVLLFTLLVTVMVLTRKVDWYKRAEMPKAAE